MALLENKWSEEGDIADMKTFAKKSELMLQLNRRLKGSHHTFGELAGRPHSAPQGGLCGLAAVYQSLQDTILTPSQLEHFTYEDMKMELATEMKLNPSQLETLPDVTDVKVLGDYYKSNC